MCWALKLLSNARSHFTFTFEHKLCLYYAFTTHFTISDDSWCSGSANHSPSSSVISPYNVYMVSEIVLGYVCNPSSSREPDVVSGRNSQGTQILLGVL